MSAAAPRDATPGALVREVDGDRPAVFPWLFSARVDLGMLVVPAIATALAASWAALTDHGGTAAPRAYAAWIAQFILGNSTHVILTFLLLGARPDMLRATRGQARLVMLGSAAAFAVAFAMYGLTAQAFPMWSDFAVCIGVVFSFHHQLSQAKGIWSLYNLRGKDFAQGPPGEKERSLQRTFVPLALALIAVRWLLVAKAQGSEIPFLISVPGLEAPLGFEVTYVLVAAWLVFAAMLGRAFLREGVRSVPKMVYVATHTVGVALMLVTPAWGGVFVASVHGLEYFALSGRMLAPRGEAETKRLTRVAPAILLAVLPLLVVGVVNAPFTRLLGIAPSVGFVWARVALNATVLAHYFADAFIYRFRIPEVRKVALRRLGFSA